MESLEDEEGNNPKTSEVDGLSECVCVDVLMCWPDGPPNVSPSSQIKGNSMPPDLHNDLCETGKRAVPAW